MDFADRAINYARNVCDLEIPACVYVRLACKRFLDDLARDDWPYVFDRDKANRVCRFMELLPHTKGKWAAKKERFKLGDWQCFIECNLFGWVHRETGLRRFRQSYEEIPRKNGKSLRLAARGTYLFCADGEAGAEVYSGATTEKQAHEVFLPAWLMVNRTNGLADRFGIKQSGNPRNPGPMYVMADLSRFEPVIGKPGDGASPHAALVDEYHEHATDDLVDTMVTGMGAREQPLLCIITTAGSDLAGPCYAKRRDIIGILEGHVKDEATFGVIYGIDEGDAWDTEEALIKANPNFGVSVFPEFLRAQLSEARRSASKQNAFRTKHLNQWVGARTAWLNMIAWQRQKTEFAIEAFGDSPCWIGVDLASKKDVAAMALLFLHEGKYYATAKFYVPEEAAAENQKYREFALDGHITLTPGSMTDYAFIEEDIKSICSRVNVHSVCFDDWQANYLMTRLLETSIPVVEYNQTVKNMSEPMKEVEARVLSRSLFHDGNPVLTWMLGNVAARIDAKGNIYPRKGSEADPNCKIDGAVALIMAMGRAIASPETDVSTFLSNPVFA